MKYLIGITGGAGAGKSTVAQALKNNYCEIIDVIEFDDYTLPTHQVPCWKGMQNWEVPEAYDFKKLKKDIEKLSYGYSIKVMHLDVEQYKHDMTIVRHAIKVEPKELLIVEGFLILHDAYIRELIDHVLFLDLPLEERISRRKFSFPTQEYIKEVFIPMNEKYVDFAKQYADTILSVDRKSKEAVYQSVVNALKKARFIE